MDYDLKTQKFGVTPTLGTRSTLPLLSSLPLTSQVMPCDGSDAFQKTSRNMPRRDVAFSVSYELHIFVSEISS